ncbi:MULTISPECIES: fumarate reductase subunit FrdD [unclassified Halorhodospira]|uniref:fumarate reductase subunit FrdD n=1 Tax=unclassified Halorhodospira TaxID=2626748 RepID=UPI001EE8B737|nr:MULTISPECIES: fumarate reductase subunit FrdD [unclassified Halorhodospira]MCG5540486.1 fumarate reductase subunit D [Halorhodospira sp. M39old]MCG5545018.1 fumarate reductase subunit D [Halorhodospira sp. M38]
MRRSHEPPLWLLFGAGGLLAALLAPALILLTGVVMPVAAEHGIEVLDYHASRELFARPVVGVPVALALGLVLCHAAHRIYHTLRDLGIPAGRGTWWVCYGGAGVAGLLGVGAVVALWW